jgi:membrane protease YdiL (CAAX protease family)
MRDEIDVARAMFINANGEARCGWRVAAFVVAVIIGELVLRGLFDGAFALFVSGDLLRAEESRSGGGFTDVLFALSITQAIKLASAGIATIICARLLEHRSAASVGFRLHQGWARDLLVGSLIGAAALALSVGMIVAAGAMKLEGSTERPVPLLGALAFSIVFFLAAAATEELVFRGFAFQAITYDVGAAAALCGTSFFFGLLHLFNPHPTWFSTINTMLAGFWLGTAYLLTRSLWLATALHYSWNFMQAFVFGLPVSGITTLSGIGWLRGTPGPPRWLSGLEYGPEGGLAVTIALTASTLLIWRGRLFSTSKEMITALDRGARGTPRSPGRQESFKG